MNTTQPLVSIIMLSYNHERYIGEAIRSVLVQTYPAWELIISDDGSSDSSLDVIRSFVDERITVIAAESNAGASAAYNKALATCHGKYITSVDSDDFIAPDKLEQQVAYLEAHPEVDILGTFVVEVDAEGQPSGDKDGHEQWFNHTLDLNNPENWIWQNRLCHSSVMLRKTIHDQIGQANNDLVYTPDNDLWLRGFVNGATFHVLPEQLTYYRSHGNNITHKNPEQFYWEYLFVFCSHLKPYLAQQGHEALLARAVMLFTDHAVWQAADATRRTRIVESLLSSTTLDQSFPTWMQQVAHASEATMRTQPHIIAVLIGHVQTQLADQQQWANDLLQANTWSEEQRAQWQQTAEQRQQLVEEQRAWIAELERSRAWLDEQRASLQRSIEQQQTVMEQQRQWIAELERGKVWLEEQRANWQTEAERLTAIVAEQQQWIAELEQAKAWHEQQTAHWQAQAAHWKEQVERLPSVIRKLTDSAL